MASIGRNDPCPCGSGSKYKKCCLPKGETHFDPEPSLERLASRVKRRDKELGIEGATEIYSPQGMRKMSEILIEFAQPYVDGADSFADKKKAFGLATVAWNLALLDEEDRASHTGEFLEAMGGTGKKDVMDGAREILRNILDDLIRRKAQLFPEIKRFIFDWELLETPEGFHLNVASTVLESEVAPGIKISPKTSWEKMNSLMEPDRSL